MQTNDTPSGDATVDTTTGTDTAAVAATDSQASTDSAKVEGQGDAGKTGEADTTATDDKTTDADKAKADAAKDDKGEPVVPEKYEVPEGYTIEPDDFEFVTNIAKERGFTQEQFNQSVEKWQEMRNAEANRTTERWGKESKDALGDKYDATVESAKRSLVALQSENPELFAKAMTMYGPPSEGGQGWGNHPVMLQVMAHFGNKLKEESMHGLGGQTAVGAGAPLESRMYPGMAKK